MFKILALVFSLLAVAPLRAQDVAVGAPERSYVDPEICLNGLPCLTYQSRWLGAKQGFLQWLDLDGFLTGMETLLTGQPADINDLRDNGPEFIRDEGIQRILHTTLEANGAEMLRISGNLIGLNDGLNRSHASGTRELAGRAVLLYRRGPIGVEPSDWFWLDLMDGVEHSANFIQQVEGSLPVFLGRLIVYTANGQIALYDIDTNIDKEVTSDSGEKFGTYPIGTSGFVAAVRRENQPLIDTIAIYSSSGAILHSYTAPFAVESPEPFRLGDRVGVVFIQAFSETSSGVYLWMLDEPVPNRIDDSGLVTRKVDPEVLIIENNLFVYYYYATNGEGTKLRRIKVQ